MVKFVKNIGSKLSLGAKKLLSKGKTGKLLGASSSQKFDSLRSMRSMRSARSMRSMTTPAATRPTLRSKISSKLNQMRTRGYTSLGGGGGGTASSPFKMPKMPKMSTPKMPKMPKIPKVDMTNISKKGAEFKTRMLGAASKAKTKAMDRIKDRAGINAKDAGGAAGSDNAMLYLLMGQSAGQGISAAVDRASQRQAQEERDKREAEARFQASNYAHM